MKTIELTLNNDDICYLKADKVDNLPFEHLNNELKKSVVKLYPEFFTWFKEKAKGRDCYGIYCYDEEIGYVLAGYLIYKCLKTDHYGMDPNFETMKICSVYVCDKFRNRGVGTLLINYFLFTNNPIQCYVTVKKHMKRLNEYWHDKIEFELLAEKNKTDEYVYGRR